MQYFAGQYEFYRTEDFNRGVEANAVSQDDEVEFMPDLIYSWAKKVKC